ncbi:MAG TPA: hypothetical protein VJM50_05280 [Pyrinomonadaceae bacterium]|nr:hypothetical protein [Pyrinomonadaceae bacterium]
MPLARRKFIKSSLIFTAAAVLFSESAQLGFARTLLEDGQLSDDVLRNPVYSFTRETFEPYVGGYFQAVGPRGEMVPLKLVKVESYSPKLETKICKRAHETESFSLMFDAEGTLPPFTSIHQIKHGALGDFSLFLTRHDGADRQICYEAVFNRLR